MNTNIELSERFYDRVSQNTQIVLKYDYKERYNSGQKAKQESVRAMLKYFF